jgi:hypothetical protein
MEGDTTIITTITNNNQVKEGIFVMLLRFKEELEDKELLFSLRQE